MCANAEGIVVCINTYVATMLHNCILYTNYLRFATSRSGVISIIPLKQARKRKVKDEMYKMIKRYYYHKTARDLNKTIFLIQGN